VKAHAVAEAEARKSFRVLHFWKHGSSVIRASNTCFNTYSRQIAAIFCALWIIESFRQSYLIHSQRVKDRESSTHSVSRSGIKLGTMARAIHLLKEAPLIAAICVFILHIVLLLPDYSSSVNVNENTDYAITELTWSALALKQSKSFCVALGMKTTKRTTIFAIRNPVLFKKRLQKILYAVRWLRYLLPIVLTFNNIAQNCKKLMITYRQHRAAKACRKIKKLLWKKASPRERAEKAAIRLQSQFRARKAMRYMHICTEKEERAAALIARSFRRHLQIARAKLQAKSNELHRLSSMGEFKNLSHGERGRKQELETELKKELREKREMLVLLRPNCLFSTLWKATVMVFVIMEIVQKYHEKRLVKLIDPLSGSFYTVESYLQQKLLPVPIADLDVCQSKTGILRRLLGRFWFTSSAQVMQVIDNPWYCQGIPASALNLYIHIARFSIQKTLVSIGVVLLLDIFVTFFTGEFHFTTGTLVPKPFVKRWIFGFALKLFLNPLSKSMATVVLVIILEAGPARVTRWYIVFVGPLMQSLLWNVWICFVQSN